MLSPASTPARSHVDSGSVGSESDYMIIATMAFTCSLAGHYNVLTFVFFPAVLAVVKHVSEKQRATSDATANIHGYVHQTES